MNSGIKAIAYYLPERILTNQELSVLYSGWSAEKILAKTGIEQRHIASTGETAGDLAEQAARKLFATHQISPDEFDFVLLATQSPDYFLPTTACILQDRLGIPKTAGALDFNLGCSAFIYGLALAKGLIAAGIAKNVLLLTAETYTKHIHPLDKSVRTIFGDAAAATWVSKTDDEEIGQFTLGTDGAGYTKLIVPTGGLREQRSAESAIEVTDDSGNVRSRDHLFMQGSEIFSFTLEILPSLLNETLAKNGMKKEHIDLFVFHQANAFMLDAIRKALHIPEEKFYINMEDIGNTVSATIPIALERAAQDGALKPGMSVLLAGFGVGLSWGATVLKWQPASVVHGNGLVEAQKQGSTQQASHQHSGDVPLAEKIAALVPVFEFDDVVLTPDTKLSDLVWDSVAHMSVIALLKEKFNRKVAYDTLRSFQTIQDILDAMEE